MADKNLPTIYSDNPVFLDPGDLGYTTHLPDSSPADAGFKFSQLMTNRYKIVPTISSNALVVTLAHIDGGAPSAARPLYFRIGDDIVAVTSSLAVSIAAGGNYLNAGSAELKTLQVPYWAYIGYVAGSSTATFGISRFPYMTVGGQFSATSTSELYGAFSTALAATDNVTVIGRFVAINSGTASYNWSVPAFTTTNLVNSPIYDSAEMDWTPTITGYGATPPSDTVYQYKIMRDNFLLNMREGTAGTSTTTTLVYTLPFSAFAGTNIVYGGLGTGDDNSAALATPVYGFISAATRWNTLSVAKDTAIAAWTNSGTKRLRSFWLRGRIN